MAVLLYYDDSHLKDFEATVLSCEQSEKGFCAVLDQTAFFPEGGGQKADTGFIGPVPVVDVQKENGEVFHYVESELEVGKKVSLLYQLGHTIRTNAKSFR